MKAYFLFIFLFFVSSVSAIGVGVSPNVVDLRSDPSGKIIIVNPNDLSVIFTLRADDPKSVSVERTSGVIEKRSRTSVRVSLKEGSEKSETFIIVETRVSEKEKGIGIIPGIAVRVLLREDNKESGNEMTGLAVQQGEAGVGRGRSILLVFTVLGVSVAGGYYYFGRKKKRSR